MNTLTVELNGVATTLNDRIVTEDKTKQIVKEIVKESNAELLQVMMQYWGAPPGGLQLPQPQSLELGRGGDVEASQGQTLQNQSVRIMGDRSNTFRRVEEALPSQSQHNSSDTYDQENSMA